MNIARFFIDRPIFATVLSIVITVSGLLAMQILPISEYPEVVPPTVQVRATFPGASPETIAETVATPLEEQINGVEDMLYMSSSATADGVMQLTVTFALGTDIDIAQVQVQNRVNQALPRLPEEVRRLGVAARKSSPDLTMVVHLTSPNRRYDVLYLRNYALIQIRDVLARLPDMGNIRILGAGDYAMRIWLDPAKVAARNLTAAEVVRAVQQENVQVSAGVLGGPPLAQPVPFQLTVNTQGRLLDEEEFGAVVIQTGREGQLTRLRDVARIELAAQRLFAPLGPGQRAGGPDRRVPSSWRELLAAVRAGPGHHGGACPRTSPRESATRSSTTPRCSSGSLSWRWSRPCSRRCCSWWSSWCCSCRPGGPRSSR